VRIESAPVTRLRSLCVRAFALFLAVPLASEHDRDRNETPIARRDTAMGKREGNGNWIAADGIDTRAQIHDEPTGEQRNRFPAAMEASPMRARFNFLEKEVKAQ